MVDVIVIGAGISGVATALGIARAGFSVTVLDAHGPAAMASGWSLAGVRQSGRHPAEIPLARKAVSMWQTLHEDLGAPTHYRRSGNLRLARTEDEVPVIEALAREQAELGLEIEYLPDNAAVRAVEPAISETVLSGTFCATDGDADPHGTVSAYVAAGRRAGVTFRFGLPVADILADKGRVTGVRLSDGEQIAAGRVVVCAGVHTPALLEPLGLSLPLQVPKVTVLRSPPAPVALGHVIGVANGDTAGRQEHDGRWRFTSGLQSWDGAIRDGRAGPSVLPTGASIAETVALFGQVVPASRDAQIEEMWCGLIDLTPDALPVLDCAPGIAGLVIGAGFSGHGFCLGPVTGEILAALALGDGTDLPIDPFRLDRFDRLEGAPAPLSLHG